MEVTNENPQKNHDTVMESDVEDTQAPRALSRDLKGRHMQMIAIGI